MAHAADHLEGSLASDGGGEILDMECQATAQGVMLTFAGVRSAISHSCCFSVSYSTVLACENGSRMVTSNKANLASNLVLGKCWSDTAYEARLGCYVS